MTEVTSVRRLFIKKTKEKNIMENDKTNMEALKKAILPGIGSGILTWVFYALINLLIDKKPMDQTLFSTFGIIFGIVMIIAEILAYYFKFKKEK